MSFETWRRQQKAAIGSIFKNTANEAIDRTRNHLTQFQEQGGHSDLIVSTEELSLRGEFPIQAGSDPYQLFYDTAMDVGVTTAKGALDLMKVGLSSFFHLVETHPVYFDDFLRRAEEFFDAYILAYCEQENIRFVGGKLRITQPAEETLVLRADFYYFTPEETWNVQHKEGELKVDAIIDWEDNPNLAELRGEGHLEYPIEPPENP